LLGYQIAHSVLMIQLLTTYPDETDRLQAIALGQKSGLEWLYKTCFITTKKMVIKMGGDDDEAWDVFQEAVTLFYEKCSTEGVQLSCRINTYITSVARNIWLKKYRQKLQYTNNDGIEEVAGAELDVQDFLNKEADLEKLTNALDTLGEPCTQLLKAFYFEKKSMQDIGTAFGYTNTDNAKTQKYKCLMRLKKIFFNSVSNNTQTDAYND
jgi:RNA polymerase sigma factor (sigma-70 family)